MNRIGDIKIYDDISQNLGLGLEKLTATEINYYL